MFSLRRKTTSPRTRPREYEEVPNALEELFGRPHDKIVAGRRTWTF